MRKKVSTGRLALIAVMAAVISVSAFISIPFAGVPITMQLFGVYLALFILGGRGGSAAVLLYISIGALGLPVFSGFSGGIGRLVDATGGFIFGFIILALVYWCLTSILPSGRAYSIISAVISTIVLYFVGALWYSVVFLGGIVYFLEAVLCTVLPFIAFDVVKIFLAVICKDLLKKQLHITD